MPEDEVERVLVSKSDWEFLVSFHEATMATMRKLFGDDGEAFSRSLRLMTDNEAGNDVQVAIDLAIHERDLARAAAARLEQGGDTYAAAVIRGLA